MEEHKIRLINEYKQLKIKYDKLHRILVKELAGTLEFELTCPVDLLRTQAKIMQMYLNVLEIRADIEGIDYDELIGR